jgi:hypothetical protein
MEGGAKILGVFRVKNHDFTPKNHIFSNFRGGVRRMRPTLGSAPASQCSNHHHGRMNLSSSKTTGSPFYLIGTFDDLIPCRGHHDRFVVRFITTYAISAYHDNFILPWWWLLHWLAGADPRVGRFRRTPPLKSEKIWFFVVKSWFFTRNTPKIFAPPSIRRNFFKCAPP